MCRSQLPDTFVRKLFTPEQYGQRLSGKPIDTGVECVGIVPMSLPEDVYNVSMEGVSFLRCTLSSGLC